MEGKKKAEIEADWRQREKGKGRAVEDMPEAGPFQPRKWRAEAEEEGLSSKRLKVSEFQS